LGGLARAHGWGVVVLDDLDRDARGLGEAQDRVGLPVVAGDAAAVEADASLSVQLVAWTAPPWRASASPGQWRVVDVEFLVEGGEERCSLGATGVGVDRGRRPITVRCQDAQCRDGAGMAPAPSMPSQNNC
jgi:hypothetical protein